MGTINDEKLDFMKYKHKGNTLSKLPMERQKMIERM
jgi:hypothetical protein